jgi:beta-glucanase (GH16 family)
MKKIFIAAFFVLIPFFISAQNYKLMWEDNFDNPVLNETQHWNVEVNGDGGGNNEMQYYRRENITIEQHSSGVNCLVITAKRENFGGKLITSGRLNTRGNVSAKFGKIEARIKLPTTGNGLWPAFWMLGEDYPTVGWPRCGEIDILEMGNVSGISQAKQDRFFNGACHWGEVWTYNAQNSTAPYSLQDDFHLYTMIWDDANIKFYLDLDKYPNNSPYYTMSIAGADVAGNVSHYFHKSFGIIFNLAVGGNYTGITGNANINQITALPVDGSPVKMYIDYVRVYQKGDVGELFSGPSTIVDTQIPTAFTATKGTVTPNSVELLLNATDNSGSVFYQITYGTSSLLVKGASGIQTSQTITGLNSSTLYNFSVIAKDANGNLAANNPLIISATTGNAFKLATIDYETVGHDWTWQSFGNGSNATDLYAVVANPSVSGINTSAQCAKYKIGVGAQSWAGIYSDNMGSVTLSPDNCKVKIMVYKSFISNFDLKFENGTFNFETLVSNTKINEWEELTFDLSAQIGKTITRMVLIPDSNPARTAERICYWDNISFNSNNPNAIHELGSTDIHIYPNPIHNDLKIKSDNQILQVIVHNLVGQIIKVVNVTSMETTINLNEIASGNYFVTIKLVNGNTVTQKMVKL